MWRVCLSHLSPGSPVLGTAPEQRPWLQGLTGWLLAGSLQERLGPPPRTGTLTDGGVKDAGSLSPGSLSSDTATACSVSPALSGLREPQGSALTAAVTSARGPVFSGTHLGADLGGCGRADPGLSQA